MLTLFTSDVFIGFLGLFASAAFITMNYILNKKLMLITQSIGMFSVGTQFGLKGIWGVTVINFIFIVRNLIVYWRDKRWDTNSTPTRFSRTKREERIQVASFFMVMVVAVYLVVNDVNFESGTSVAMFIFPLLAAMTNVMALAQQELLPLKIWIVLSTLCWVAFDMTVGSWQNLIGDIFGFIAGTIAIVRIVQNRTK